MNDALETRLLSVASGPHRHGGASLARMQMLWCAALLPAAAAGVAAAGWDALRVLTLAVGAAVACDALAGRLLTPDDRAPDWNSAVLGLLLGLLLPPTTPWWLVLVGCVLTVGLGKRLFGGWGAHPVHPVAAGYAMLLVSWPDHLDNTAGALRAAWEGSHVEPMRLVQTLGAQAEGFYETVDLLLGRQAAGAGAGMVLWLLLGGLVLVALREIPWQIPLGFLAGTALCAFALEPAAGDQAASPLFHLLAGNTVLAAFFLAPEPSDSPVNRWPMLLYGLLGGALLVLIRTFSGHVDGAVFAILLINLAAPLLDRWTPRVAGLTEGAADA